MIRSFKHKGLEKFFRTGSKAGIQPAHARRLSQLLTALNVAAAVGNVDAAGWDLHQLSGELAGQWALKVNGNWRLTFRFVDGDVEVVDYRDYH